MHAPFGVSKACVCCRLLWRGAAESRARKKPSSQRKSVVKSRKISLHPITASALPGCIISTACRIIAGVRNRSKIRRGNLPSPPLKLRRQSSPIAVYALIPGYFCRTYLLSRYEQVPPAKDRYGFPYLPVLTAKLASIRAAKLHRRLAFPVARQAACIQRPSPAKKRRLWLV